MARDKRNDRKRAIAKINAAMAMLEKYPKLDVSKDGNSSKITVNPFDFIMDVLRSTGGYDKIINMLSEYIAYSIPVLELAVKGILIEKIKDILNCSVNPFISDEILRDGVNFNLRRVDIQDILMFSPLDPNVGRHFYFGCDDLYLPDDLYKSSDMNAFLYYMKTRSIFRTVWGQTSDESKRTNKSGKQKKEDGIITVEYHERSNKLKDSLGNAFTHMQFPSNYCLHVMLGNTLPTTYSNYDSNRQKIHETSNRLYDINKDIESKQEALNEYKETLDIKKKQYKTKEIDEDTYKTEKEAIEKNIKNVREEIHGLEDEAKKINKERSELYETLRSGLQNEKNYRGIEHNYYYRKSLYEFCFDYIMSLQFFEKKTLTAQLISSLTSCLEISYSHQQAVIRNEIKRLVDMVVETDDGVVNDCFYSFSNDEYNSLLNKTEMMRNGLLPNEDGNSSSAKVDAKTILEKLNEINPDADEQEVHSIINNALTEISKTLSDTNYQFSDSGKLSVSYNIIESLLSHLAFVITCQIVSPKVYILLALNLKILGQQTDFSLEAFIRRFEDLLVSLIRGVRDQLLQHFTNELLKMVGNLSGQVALKLHLEQIAYYGILLKKLIDCFKRKKNKGNLDFDIDNIDYADIYGDNEEPENNEC